VQSSVESSGARFVQCFGSLQGRMTALPLLNTALRPKVEVPDCSYSRRYSRSTAPIVEGIVDRLLL
jgi:hypothetical protein